MKSLSTVLWILMLTLFTASICAAQDLYYWNVDDSIPLTICSTYVSVKPTDPVGSPPGAAILQHAYLVLHSIGLKLKDLPGNSAGWDLVIFDESHPALRSGWANG